jgi:YesN/AraC family two-component response regulator
MKAERVLLFFDRKFIDPVKSVLMPTDIDSLFFDRERMISLPATERNVIDMVLRKIHDEHTLQKEGHVDMARALTAQLLVSLIRHGTAVEPVVRDSSWRNSASAYAVSDIVNYIDQNFYNHITLSTLSKQFYMNASALSRSFKSVMSVTLTDYINQKRIEKAKELLEQRNDSISVTSAQVGFNTPTYFLKIFKRYTGLSPVAYKNQTKCR